MISNHRGKKYGLMQNKNDINFIYIFYIEMIRLNKMKMEFVTFVFFQIENSASYFILSYFFIQKFYYTKKIKLSERCTYARLRVYIEKFE